jgi:hypothetical protein
MCVCVFVCVFVCVCLRMCVFHSNEHMRASQHVAERRQHDAAHGAKANAQTVALAHACHHNLVAVLKELALLAVGQLDRLHDKQTKIASTSAATECAWRDMRNLSAAPCQLEHAAARILALIVVAHESN